MPKILIALALLIAPCLVHAQKCLQLEKYGSLKRDRYYIGDDITFKLYNGQDVWYTRTITDFDVDRGYIISFQNLIHVDSIQSLRIRRGSAMQILGGSLQIGGANTMLFAIFWPVFNGQPVDGIGVASGAVLIGLGTLLRRVFRFKQFKVGKRKRLRLLDLNFGPPAIPSQG